MLDNLSAHKTQAVEEFLAQHPKVRFHFTPTYSSWLNQVELWFAKIQRDVISRGVFTSVADLARKLRKYIGAYAKSARPFRWTYTDPRKRIRINEITGTTFFKRFRRKIIQSIPIEENRFGFELEITVNDAKRQLRIYEVVIGYWGRTY